MLIRVSRRAARGAEQVLVVLIRIYQRCISPALGPRCRFYPSCSDYCVGALKKYGLARGLWKSGLRLCKCQPFHPGGVDFP